MGTFCISDFCYYENENQKEKKEEYNLASINLVKENPLNISNKTNSLLRTTITTKTRNIINTFQEKSSTLEIFDEEDLVNYKDKNDKNIRENFSLSIKEKNKYLNDYIEDEKWKKLDITFLVDIFTYNSIKENEIIYQTKVNLINQNNNFIEINDTLTLGSKEVNCIIKKKKMTIETINSVSSSLSFALSDNDSKLSETCYKSNNINSNKIILNIKGNDSVIFSINFNEFYFDLKKFDYNSKGNDFYSLAKIEYCDKKYQEEKNNIILSSNFPDKLNYILKLILFLSHICK